jgi:chromosome segregation ATPase
MPQPGTTAEQLRAELDAARASIATRDQLVKSSRDETEAMRKELNSVQDMAVALRQEAVESHATVEDLRGQLDSLTKARDQAEAEARALAKANEQLEARITALQPEEERLFSIRREVTSDEFGGPVSVHLATITLQGDEAEAMKAWIAQQEDPSVPGGVYQVTTSGAVRRFEVTTRSVMQVQEKEWEIS